jgi:hypothetical protein
MLKNSGEYRLSYSIVFSVLMHLLVFFSIVFLGQHFPPIRQPSSRYSIQVKLAQHPFISSKATTDRILKISAAPPFLRNLPTPPKLAANINTKPEQPSQEAVRGIAFPGAISHPFIGGTGSGNGFSTPARPAQPIAQIQFQQAMAEQARQRSATQIQAITEHLQQRLKQLLTGQERVSGQCLLTPADGLDKPGADTKQFECSSPKLLDMIRTEQQSLIDQINTLNRQGKSVQGFSVDMRTEAVEIILIQTP